MAMTQKPLLLKDFLKLDPNSDSSLSLSSTMRHLLVAELGHPVATTSSPLSKLSSFIHSLKLLPSPSSSSSASFPVSRTFSKRLKRSFWKKRPRQHEFPNTIKVKDIMRLGSFNDGVDDNDDYNSPRSPIASSSRSNSSRWSSASGSEFPDVNSDKDSLARAVGGATATGRQDTKDLKKKTMENDYCFDLEEEKEQLSPVSVMDFPFRHEDDEEALQDEESFHRSLAAIERPKHQLLQNIRRFEFLADLDPVDLDPLFEDSSHVAILVDGEKEEDDDEMVTRARDLVKSVQPNTFGNTADKSFEKLLVDFFIERLSCADQVARPRIARQEEGGEVLVKHASDWLKGECRRWDEEERGESYLEEMERDGRWRCFEEEREMGLGLEVALLNSLLDEMVMALLC